NYECDRPNDLFAATTVPATADTTHGVVRGVAHDSAGGLLRGLVDVRGPNVAVVASGDGRYSIALPPGTYGLEFAPFDRPPMCNVFRVTVVAHDIATVDFTCR